MAVPTTEEWISITEGPKRIANSGSEFFNCKGTFSIVLLAVVDTHYCFLVVDGGGAVVVRRVPED